MKPLDFTSLSRPVSISERFDYINQKTNAKIIFWLFSAVGLILLVGLSIAVTAKQAVTSLVAPVGIITLILLIVSVSQYLRAATSIRMRQFAKANGFEFYEGSERNESGLIFSRGRSRHFRIFQATNQPWSELGNYNYTIGSGKNRQTFYYYYLRIPLPRRLPNMVLDSKKNNIFGMSNLPEKFSRNQKLELEGDFNNYFTLYAPAEYKTDALYIFTPDVMQAMIATSGKFDAEIVDDNLYLYAQGRYKLTNSKKLKTLFELAATLNKEFDRQALYYTDDNVGNRTANTIAEPGRRLKSHTPTLMVVALVIYVLYVLYTSFTDLLT